MRNAKTIYIKLGVNNRTKSADPLQQPKLTAAVMATTRVVDAKGQLSEVRSILILILMTKG